jgi:MOSC domain-containing protein YiiM
VTGRIVQISVSRGGLPKTAVPAARVTIDGVAGDAHCDREHHGGPDRAVCLFALEALDALRAEGHAVVPGALGENVTVQGLAWDAVTPGVHLLLGAQVRVAVTSYTSPCLNIAAAFRDRNYARVSQKRHPGWSRVYARVLTEGTIAAGDPVRLLETRETVERRSARTP